jgi:hypothetical protein
LGAAAGPAPSAGKLSSILAASPSHSGLCGNAQPPNQSFFMFIFIFVPVLTLIAWNLVAAIQLVDLQSTS